MPSCCGASLDSFNSPLSWAAHANGLWAACAELFQVPAWRLAAPASGPGTEVAGDFVTGRPFLEAMASKAPDRLAKPQPADRD